MKPPDPHGSGGLSSLGRWSRAGSSVRLTVYPLDDAIRAARADGWAVTDIARALGVTRQAVYDALDRR